MSLTTPEVYNQIATEFDKTRSPRLKAKGKAVSCASAQEIRSCVWPNVRTFLDTLPVGSTTLDIGCGNGKNMLYRCDLNFKGVDVSSEQVRICKEKGLDVLESSMCLLPCSDCEFDNAICIAAYHHLGIDLDRAAALQEMYRCLKPGGKVLITVWAMEQEASSRRKFEKRHEYVPWKSKGGEIHYRYYHIYSEGSLEEEIRRLEPRFSVEEVGWEAGNWWIVLGRS